MIGLWRSIGPSIRARQAAPAQQMSKPLNTVQIMASMWSSRSHYEQPEAANNDTLYVGKDLDKNTMLNFLCRCDGGIKWVIDNVIASLMCVLAYER